MPSLALCQPCQHSSSLHGLHLPIVLINHEDTGSHIFRQRLDLNFTPHKPESRIGMSARVERVTIARVVRLHFHFCQQ